ncbi:phage tail protein [Alkalicaulis satelles]|uniref:Phage tail protein n=1 Tax=Alkalicaulis satelles TaxID=2609175 RepID=A0A5M6ZJ72_9PROT|nr:tail fiber protein [Alkalicaulis satelles]KAA5804862.1 phage tail protein [Alkalicaulis satelles]
MKRMMMMAAGLAAAALCQGESHAQADYYIADVILVGYDFCPQDTVEANGQILSIAQNQALYSLIGSTYGGNGVTTFAVPDLRGRIPVGAGTGPGLSPVTRGQSYGAGQVTLTQSNLAPHTHTVLGSSTLADTVSPENASPPTFAQNRYKTGGIDVTMDDDTISHTGGSQPVDIHAPTLGLRFCMVITGVYPTPPD